jgi:hypothetical protein
LINLNYLVLELTEEIRNISADGLPDLHLNETERDYFENRKESEIDKEKLDQFVKEIDSVDMVGDEVVWLN